MRAALLLGLTLLPLAACTTLAPNTVVPERTVAWHNVVTPSDRTRLRNWRTRWVEGLAQATKAGHGAEIAREGVLLQPDAALPGPAIPNGDYRCRTIKLGAQGGQTAGLLPYIAYPYFQCRIGADGHLQSFAKLSGSQRPIGALYPDDDLRLTFLGTLVLGDERRALQYGLDNERDMVGFVERIGPSRWRLVLPEPHFESLVDVIELVPA
jgi:hypothetical protein